MDAVDAGDAGGLLPPLPSVIAAGSILALTSGGVATSGVAALELLPLLLLLLETRGVVVARPVVTLTLGGSLTPALRSISRMRSSTTLYADASLCFLTLGGSFDSVALSCAYRRRFTCRRTPQHGLTQHSQGQHKPYPPTLTIPAIETACMPPYL